MLNKLSRAAKNRRGVVPADLRAGTLISAPSGKQYTIDRFVDRGRRGIVYKVHSDDGTEFALKVAVSGKRKVLRSIQKEQEKSDTLQKYDIPHTRVVDIGPNFVVKEWACGLRFDAWREHWERDGFPHEPLPLVVLFRQIREYASKGLLIKDINRKGIFWNGKIWRLVDTSSIIENMSDEAALENYRAQLKRKWSLDASNRFIENLNRHWDI